MDPGPNALPSPVFPWIERFQRRLKRWRAAGIGPRWVVAVSGGSDSVGLLRLLHASAPGAGLTLSVAHLDHGARGESARADADFVAALAAALDLPFDLGRWQPTRSGHFEADARAARYAWLAELASARDAAAVAVGHTRDDQAETVLHRIVRGTGLQGLAGIPARRPLAAGVSLVRPLLPVSRAAVRTYLDRLGQPYRDDATNADLSRTRARIRHDLLPKLAAEYNPAIVAALVRLGRLAGGSSRSLQRRLIEMERVATIWAEADSIGLNRQVLAEYPGFLRAELLRRVWRRVGWPEGSMSARRWRRLARLVGDPSGRLSVGAGVEVVLDPFVVILRRRTAKPEPDPPEALILPVPGVLVWPGGRIVATLDPASSYGGETVDLDQLAPPLWVRPPKAGDRFEPLGMDGQGMSLNDFFRGRQVAREERGKVPLVCDRAGIVWVVGHRIAHRVRLTEATRRTVGLAWEGDSPSLLS
jgi:tRNA(Ile)-lysidine synthase